MRERAQESARRVLAFKKKTSARHRESARHLRQYGEKLTRQLWEFGEEIAANCQRSTREAASMIVAGVMSGTSADGINVALVQFAASTGENLPRRLAHSMPRATPCSATRNTHSLLPYAAQFSN